MLTFLEGLAIFSLVAMLVLILASLVLVFLDYGKAIFTLIGVLVFLVIWILSLAGSEFYLNVTTTQELINVTATVIETEYQSAYTTIVPYYNGNTTITQTQYHPPKYLVTISYGELTETFDNANLFNSVSEGNNIDIILCNYYDAEDTLVKQKLKLPD